MKQQNARIQWYWSVQNKLLSVFSVILSWNVVYSHHDLVNFESSEPTSALLTICLLTILITFFCRCFLYFKLSPFYSKATMVCFDLGMRTTSLYLSKSSDSIISKNVTVNGSYVRLLKPFQIEGIRFLYRRFLKVSYLIHNSSNILYL